MQNTSSLYSSEYPNSDIFKALSEMLNSLGTKYILKDINGNIVYFSDNEALKLYKGVLDKPTVDGAVQDGDRYYEIRNLAAGEYVASLIVDVTQLHNLRVQLKKSHTDDTTHLYTKDYTKELIMNYLKNVINSDEEEEFTLVMVDLDHFKQLNDRYGHNQGDAVLGIIGNLLLKHTRHSSDREQDIVGRFGGEEFLVVLKEIDARASSDKLEILRAKIERSKSGITASFGATHVNSSYLRQHFKSIQEQYSNLSDEKIIEALLYELLEFTDANLYTSKSAGRNTVTFTLYCPKDKDKDIRT